MSVVLEMEVVNTIVSILLVPIIAPAELDIDYSLINTNA